MIATDSGISQAALQRINYDGHSREVSDVIVSRVKVKIVMIEEVEALSTELQRYTLRYRERLAYREVEVPRSRTYKSISCAHAGGEGTEVPYAIR